MVVVGETLHSLYKESLQNMFFLQVKRYWLEKRIWNYMNWITLHNYQCNELPLTHIHNITFRPIGLVHPDFTSHWLSPFWKQRYIVLNVYSGSTFLWLIVSSFIVKWFVIIGRHARRWFMISQSSACNLLKPLQHGRVSPTKRCSLKVQALFVFTLLLHKYIFFYFKHNFIWNFLEVKLEDLIIISLGVLILILITFPQPMINMTPSTWGVWTFLGSSTGSTGAVK